jgi:hypothetical protein
MPLVKWQCKFEVSIELSGFTGPLLPMRGVKSRVLRDLRLLRPASHGTSNGKSGDEHCSPD